MTERDTDRLTVSPDSNQATRDYEASSHEGVQLMADERVFEPGPSFSDTEPPTDRLAEMPAWLQTFVASQDTPDETPSESQEPVLQSAESFRPVEPDSTVPEWLRAEPAHSETATEVATLSDFDNFAEPAENGADTFISEDDLPDWLRAFSHETRDVPDLRSVSPARMANYGPATSSATLVRVPPIENVWLSSNERQALGPGRTLFALLASNAGTATLPDENGTHATEGGESSRSTGEASARSTGAPAASARSASEDKVDAPRSPVRMLLLALIVVVLLVFVAVMLL